MKAAAILFLSALVAHATPLDDFKAALNTPIEEKLPDISRHINSRVQSQNNPILERDAKRKAVEDHQRFVRHLLDGVPVTFDEYAMRTDRFPVKSVKITPYRWAMMVLDDAYPFRASAVDWQASGPKEALFDAFAALLKTANVFREQGASPYQRQFYDELKKAISAFTFLGARTDVDERQAALKFLRTYGTK